MTLTSETVRTQAAGTGSQISFSVSFQFWDLDDLQIIHTDSSGVETTWVRGTQYTISDHVDGVVGTGTVDVVTSPTDYTPANGETLTFRSNLSITQDTSLPAGGPFPSVTVEQQMDKIVREIQQQVEALGRAIKLPVSSAFTDLAIPDPEATKFLRWNSAADALENAAVTDGGDIGIPVTIAEGGPGEITAAAAFAGLKQAAVSNGWWWSA